MARQKEVIVIGLGEFGQRVVSLLNEFENERAIQMDAVVRDKTKTHSIVFLKEDSFSYTKYSTAIRELVKFTDTRKNNGSFNYIIIGDLYDKFTASFGVDFAYLPWVLNNEEIILKDKVLGFFTFSDENDKYSKESNSLLRNYLLTLSSFVGEKNYIPPYKDSNGQSFNAINNNNGPYNRDYIVTTPGDQDAVNEQTSRIFAERIFYELYYLSENFEQQEKNADRGIESNIANVFSTMSMVQISRIAEIQRYYLKCRLHEYTLNYYLADEPKGTDLSSFKENFYAMMEFPFKNKKFPMERAVELFINTNKKQFENLLNIYVARENSGLTDYIEECKKRIDDRLLKLQPEYEVFVKNEIENLISILSDGLKKLFTIDRFAGNFKTYFSYLEELESYLKGWENDFESIVDSTEIASFEEEYNKADEKIKKLESNKIYNFPLFKPIRQRLINNTILSLPLEEFIISVVRKNLAESFLLAWKTSFENATNPALLCSTVKNNLKDLEKKIIEKRDLVRKKIDLIEILNTYYYVISSIDDEKYKQILNRIEELNFGLSRKSELDKFAFSQFKSWTVKDNLIDIVAAPTEFLEFIESKVNEDTQFLSLDGNVVETDDYAVEALRMMKERIEANCQKSFAVNEGFLGKTVTLLEPQNVHDALMERAAEEHFSDFNSINVHKDFTLGSLIYFKDYLYMPVEKLQKMASLEKSKDVKIGSSGYVDDDMSGEAENSELSRANKYCRAILLDYLQPEQVSELYNKKYNRNETSLSPKQVNALAKTIDPNIPVSMMTIDQMEKYGKEYDVLFTEDHDAMAGRIIHFINKQSN